MIFGIPLAIWFGFITIIFLIVTFSLGISMFYFQKPVFKFHRFFAFTTIIFAIIHLVFAFLLWFKGIVI